MDWKDVPPLDCGNNRGNVDEIIGFHLPTEPHGCFSNWAASGFVYAGVAYNCAEQYMMAQKVSLGQRFDLRDLIMDNSDPQIIKDFGGKDYFPEFMKIKPIWEKNCRYIVKRGVKAKFQQNPEYLQELLDTGDALLAECARTDTTWGIGINLKDPAWHDVANWSGSNYLGQILMEVRAELRAEILEKGAVQYIDFRDAAPILEWEMKVLQLKRIPQYYSAIHAYADQIPAGHERDAFYNKTLAEVEKALHETTGKDYPVAGFYEMKQEIYEIARSLSNKKYKSEIFRVEVKGAR